MENELNLNQKCLAELNVDEDDVLLLSHESKMLPYMTSCKQKHAGPFTSEDKLHATVDSWRASEKS